MRAWLQFLWSLRLDQPAKTFRFIRALWHVLQYRLAGKPVLTPINIRASRESTCSKCPHHKDLFCNLCGCLLMSKTRLSSESCPDDPPRWLALYPGKMTDEEAGADGGS